MSPKSMVKTPPRVPKRNAMSLTPTPVRPRKRTTTTDDQDHWHWVPSLEAFASYVARYVTGVGLRAINLMRWPLILLASVWLLLFILSRISHHLQQAFMPFCRIPGVPHIMPFCAIPIAQDGINIPLRADYPQLVQVQSATFEQLLENNVGGSGLSLEIKKAEMATNDLETVIRASDLTSRDLLAENLERFSRDARKVGRGLQRLGSKLGGSVDR